MCLLITITDIDDDYAIFVASNRDEDRARKAAPPGLWVGEHRRVLCPRDRRAGGTWMGVNDRGMFAGLTNLAGVPKRDGATTRGVLPHLALDQDDVDGAVGAVIDAVADGVFDGFQLLVTDGATTRVLVHRDGHLDDHEFSGGAVVLSNEHRVGELGVPGIEGACAEGLTVDERLDRLRPVLLDEGEHSGHRILKKGGAYGTVSSALIAVPRDDSRRLVWRFAAGPPDETPYRDYGNLGRRLVER